MNQHPDVARYLIPHGVWTIVPYTGMAFLQSTGTSVAATWTGDDLVIDTDGAIRVRPAEVSGVWRQGAIHAEPVAEVAA